MCVSHGVDLSTLVPPQLTFSRRSQCGGKIRRENPTGRADNSSCAVETVLAISSNNILMAVFFRSNFHDSLSKSPCEKKTWFCRSQTSRVKTLRFPLQGSNRKSRDMSPCPSDTPLRWVGLSLHKDFYKRGGYIRPIPCMKQVIPVPLRFNVTTIYVNWPYSSAMTSYIVNALYYCIMRTVLLQWRWCVCRRRSARTHTKPGYTALTCAKSPLTCKVCPQFGCPKGVCFKPVDWKLIGNRNRLLLGWLLNIWIDKTTRAVFANSFTNFKIAKLCKCSCQYSDWHYWHILQVHSR